MDCSAIINFLCDSQLRLDTSDEEKFINAPSDRGLERIPGNLSVLDKNCRFER